MNVKIIMEVVVNTAVILLAVTVVAVRKAINYNQIMPIVLVS